MKLQSSHFLAPTALVLSTLLVARVASPASSSYERASLARISGASAMTRAVPKISKVAPRSEAFVAPNVRAHTEPGDDPAISSPDLRPAHPLRRLLKKETTRAIAKQARVIIDAHSDAPIGTEVPFQADGEEYVARIEVHYHPPGGDKKPWGEHPGVSVFVARPWP